MGATEIDVIVLQPRHQITVSPPANNAFMLMLKTFNFMQHQLAQNDIHLSLIESRMNGIKIRLIHTPEELTDNSFIFDPRQMHRWWIKGYAHAERSFQDGLWR